MAQHVPPKSSWTYLEQPLDVSGNVSQLSPCEVLQNWDHKRLRIVGHIGFRNHLIPSALWSTPPAMPVPYLRNYCVLHMLLLYIVYTVYTVIPLSFFSVAWKLTHLSVHDCPTFSWRWDVPAMWITRRVPTVSAVTTRLPNRSRKPLGLPVYGSPTSIHFKQVLGMSSSHPHNLPRSWHVCVQHIHAPQHIQQDPGLMLFYLHHDIPMKSRSLLILKSKSHRKQPSSFKLVYNSIQL